MWVTIDWKNIPWKKVLAWSFAIGVVAMIFTVSNLDLVEKRRKCWDNQIDTLAFASVIDNKNGLITYLLNDLNTTCHILIVGGSSLTVNATVFLYRSDSGKCDTAPHDDECGFGVTVFNVLYSIIGVLATLGFILGCIEACFDIKLLKDDNDVQIQPVEVQTTSTATTNFELPVIVEDQSDSKISH